MNTKLFIIMALSLVTITPAFGSITIGTITNNTDMDLIFEPTKKNLIELPANQKTEINYSLPASFDERKKHTHWRAALRTPEASENEAIGHLTAFRDPYTNEVSFDLLLHAGPHIIQLWKSGNFPIPRGFTEQYVLNITLEGDDLENSSITPAILFPTSEAPEDKELEFELTSEPIDI